MQNLDEIEKKKRDGGGNELEPIEYLKPKKVMTYAEKVRNKSVTFKEANE